MTDESDELFSNDDEELLSINTETFTCEPLSEFVRWAREKNVSLDKMKQLIANERQRQERDAKPKYDEKRFLGRELFDYTDVERDAIQGNPIRVRTCDLTHIDNNHRKCNDDDSHAPSDWEERTGIDLDRKTHTRKFPWLYVPNSVRKGNPIKCDIQKTTLARKFVKLPPAIGAKLMKMKFGSEEFIEFAKLEKQKVFKELVVKYPEFCIDCNLKEYDCVEWALEQGLKESDTPATIPDGTQDMGNDEQTNGATEREPQRELIVDEAKQNVSTRYYFITTMTVYLIILSCICAKKEKEKSGPPSVIIVNEQNTEDNSRINGITEEGQKQQLLDEGAHQSVSYALYSVTNMTLCLMNLFCAVVGKRGRRTIHMKKSQRI